MSRHPHLVTAASERPLRDAGRFVVVTYLIATAAYLPLLATDLGWIDTALPPGLGIVGIMSPGLATLIIRLYDDGLAGVRDVFGGLAAWRFGRGWWGVTLTLPPILALGLAGGIMALGQDFSPEPLRVLSEAGVAFIPLILLTVVTGFTEEIGWRGHLLPLLQARTSALTASLVVGVIWGVWHVPLLYGAGVEGSVMALRFFSTVGGAVMFTWVFNNTGGSVLAVTLLHAGNNVWGRLLARSPTEPLPATVFTAEITLLAVVLIVVFGAATLTDRRRFLGS